MQSFPHHYEVVATAGSEGDVMLAADKVDAIPSAAPAEFGGPGDRWSPETLLVAAVADCFVLSFRAIARASKLSWQSLECRAGGTLERVDGTTRFTGFVITATLHLPAGSDAQRAHRLLEKAEASCLITHSLTGPTRLDAKVLTTS